jgi:sugar/nucleoside kinase (ribokinase family)
VVTSAEAAYPLFAQAPSIGVHRLPAQRTTTFENVYLPQGRCQYVRGLATALTTEDLPKAWQDAPIIHLGPVAREVDVQLVGDCSSSFLGLTLQGWLRRWDGNGLVSYATWDEGRHALHAADVVVLSLEDLEGDRRRLTPYVSETEHLVLTEGREGATVYHRGQVMHMPAYRVREIDPTGAGDVFATAYFVRFAETEDVGEALRFANAAASFAVETAGAVGMPSRQQIACRLRHGQLRE